MNAVWVFDIGERLADWVWSRHATERPPNWEPAYKPEGSVVVGVPTTAWPRRTPGGRLAFNTGCWDEIAQAVWPLFTAANDELFHRPLDWLEVRGIQRYDPGEGVGPHEDEPGDETIPGNWPSGIPQLAMTLSLTDPGTYTGGELRMYPHAVDKKNLGDPVTFELPKGCGVIFPCELLHEVTPVTAGVRCALIQRTYDSTGSTGSTGNLEQTPRFKPTPMWQRTERIRRDGRLVYEADRRAGSKRAAILIRGNRIPV